MTADLDRLREMVALMRELGVTEYEGIKLGAPAAPPPKEPTPEEIVKKIRAQMERQHEIMFAASSTRPGLGKVKL